LKKTNVFRGPLQRLRRLKCRNEDIETVKVLCIALLLGFTLDSLAQTSKPADWEKMCKDITSKSLTEPRLTRPLSAAQLTKCDSEALYYGFDSKPDYAAALQCAWYERAHPDTVAADMIRGVGVLTMLYANGRGTAKDPDLAMRFACEEQWAAPAEMQIRMQHLVDIKDGKPQGMPFDMCDDITSGLNMGKCADVQQRFADADRAKRVSAITAKLTPSQQALYDRLHSAEDNFEIVRVNNEIDLSGTARAMFALSDRGKLRDEFLINLQRFSKSDIPQATPADMKNLDAQMNVLYQKILQAPEDAFPGTVKPPGIRDTQRAWLKLRDAWMDFAKSAYPGLLSDRVMAQLIRLRLNQLRLLPVDVRN
jgi:uncharacterized protein YecT (DUF1311 family)